MLYNEDCLFKVRIDKNEETHSRWMLNFRRINEVNASFHVGYVDVVFLTCKRVRAKSIEQQNE
jgi:hypothetical protein